MGRKKLTENGKHQEFGDRLQFAFDDVGIKGTYISIGKLFNVSGPTIGNLLNGVKLPKMELAIDLAQRTKTPVDWLLTGRRARSNSESLPVYPPAQDNNSLLSGLSNKEKDHIIAIIKSMKSSNSK